MFNYSLFSLLFCLLSATIYYVFVHNKSNHANKRNGQNPVRFMSVCLLSLSCSTATSVKAAEFFAVKTLTTGDDNTLSIAATKAKHAAYRFDTWQQLVHKWRVLSKNGMRLKDIEVLQLDGKRIYTGVWKPGTGKHALFRYSSWKAFTDKWSTLNGKGYRLIDVERVKHGNAIWYYGVWSQGSGTYALYQYKSWSAFTSKWNELKNKGLHMIDFDLTEDNSITSYVGVWRGAAGGQAFYNFGSWSQLVDKWNSLGKVGYQLIDMDVTRLSNGTTRYSGVWQPGPSKRALYRYTTWSAFKGKWASLADKGYALLDLEVAQRGVNGVWYIGSFGPAPSVTAEGPDLRVMAQAIEDLFSQDQVVGMSYAISQHGQMAIAGSTGFAQRSPDTDILMDSKAVRSTVASVSKAITAPLVYKLLAANSLTLDSPIAPWLPASWTLGNGFENNADGVTFRHLLTHTSGLNQAFTALNNAGQAGPWGNGWDGLKFVVENGTVPGSTRQYKNANFALLRILIPELWASAGGPGGQITKDNVGDRYLDYLHQLIVNRAGIDPIACWAQPEYAEAKSYNFDDEDLAGAANSSTLDGCGGHANLHFSAQELVKYIDAFRFDDSLMSPADRLIMDTERAGWNTTYNVTDGQGFAHGGAWNRSGGRRTRTCVIKLPHNVDASIIIDSMPTVGSCSGLRQAYQTAMQD